MTQPLHLSNDPEFQYETIIGTVEKGPFISGTEVFVQELDENLSQTGGIFESIGGLDSEGNFEIRTSELESNYILAKATGKYFNEITGKISGSNLTLKVLSDVANKSTMNINVLSHLETERIDYLVFNNGLSFVEAKAQAESEVLAIFEIYDEIPESELLDISNSGALLAVSSIIQGYRTELEVQDILDEIRNDIKEDGILDNSELGTDLISQSIYLSESSIESNLNDHYATLELNKDVPEFYTYINDFINNSDFISSSIINYPRNLDGYYNLLYEGEDKDSIINFEDYNNLIICVNSSIPFKIRITNLTSSEMGAIISPSSGWEKLDGEDNNFLECATTTKETASFIFSWLPGQIQIEYFEGDFSTPSITKIITMQ